MIRSPGDLVGGGGKRHNAEHAGPSQATTEDEQSIVIQNMANTGGFENNITSASLLGRRGVSAQLGANPCVCKGGTTTTIHERYGMYYVDLFCPEMHTTASIYTNTHNVQGTTSRSHDREGSESHEDYDPWTDEGGSSGDEESRANAAVVTVIYIETGTHHEHDQ